MGVQHDMSLHRQLAFYKLPTNDVKQAATGSQVTSTAANHWCLQKKGRSWRSSSNKLGHEEYKHEQGTWMGKRSGGV